MLQVHKWHCDSMSSLSPVRPCYGLYFAKKKKIYSLFSSISEHVTSPSSFLLFWNGVCGWVVENPILLAQLWAPNRLEESRGAEKRSQRKLPTSYYFDEDSSIQLECIHLFTNTFTSHMKSAMVLFSAVLPTAGKIPSQQLLVCLPFHGHIYDSFQFIWWTLIHKVGVVNVWLEVRNYVSFLQTLFAEPSLSSDWCTET